MYREVVFRTSTIPCLAFGNYVVRITKEGLMLCFKFMIAGCFAALLVLSLIQPLEIRSGNSKQILEAWLLGFADTPVIADVSKTR